MAWSERLESGKYRGAYRDRRGNQLYTDETYSQPAEAKAEAQRKEDEVRRRINYRKNAGKLPYEQWHEEWKKKRRVEPGTAKRDESRARAHVIPQWEGWPLEDIDRDDVQDWVDGLCMTYKTKVVPAGKGVAAGKGQFRVETDELLSPSTIIKVFRLFSASMSAAVVKRRIGASPCVKIELPPLEPPDEYFLTPEGYRTLQKHAPSPRARMFNSLGVNTGGRWGELFGLHRERISIAEKRVVFQEVYDLSRHEIKPYPKDGDRRGVPITTEAADELDQWMRENPPVPCRTRHRGGRPCNGTLLLATPAGTPPSYANFRRDDWNPMIKAAELLGLRPHDLRHTYASWLIQRGISLEALQKLLGHANLSTTQRYAHLADSAWEAVRGALRIALHEVPQNADGSFTITDMAVGEAPEEAAVVAQIERLAAVDPAKWGPVIKALTSGDVSAAPDLLHDDLASEGGKIITVDFSRRSTGS